LLNAAAHGDVAVVRVLADVASVDARCDCLSATFKNNKLSKGDMIAIRDAIIKRGYGCGIGILADPVVLRFPFIVEPIVAQISPNDLLNISSRELFIKLSSLTLADRKAMLEYSELLLNEVQRRLSANTVPAKDVLTKAADKLRAAIENLKRLISQTKPEIKRSVAPVQKAKPVPFAPLPPHPAKHVVPSLPPAPVMPAPVIKKSVPPQPAPVVVQPKTPVKTIKKTEPDDMRFAF